MEGVQEALEVIGSVQNITLTELARNRRLLFVEGLDDYKIIRRFARHLGYAELATGTGLTALESGGYESWQKVQSLAWGFRNTLGADLQVAAVYDRDYRCEEHLLELKASLEREVHLAHFHRRKEIENYLLNPDVLNRLGSQLLQERVRRTGVEDDRTVDVRPLLKSISKGLKNACSGQYIAKYCDFFKRSGKDQATLASEAMEIFETTWTDLNTRMEILPGKEVLRRLRELVQEEFSITLTDIRIVDAYKAEEVPDDMLTLIEALDAYRAC